MVSDQAGSFSLRRFDSGGAVLGEVSLSSAADNGDFAIASGPGGDAWVSGGVSDGGPAGFGVWHVSADGQALISSAAVYGDYDIYAGGVAVDASSRAWVTAPQVLDSTGSVRFALWRFEEDGSVSSGFPKYQRRAEGVLDGALSVAVDSSGDIWSAGVSLAPGATAYDLALWRYDQDGNPRNGFPVYRGSAYATLDEIEPGIVIAAGDKVWVTASQLFPGCGDQRQQALFRFDLNGNVELQRYWHNAEETGSNGRSIALASDGSPWVLGRSSNTAAVWAYDRYGGLEPGYPRTDESLNMTGIALDAGDAPWVVYGSTPGAFVGAQIVAGAEGPPTCAQLAAGTISGSVVVEGGAPEGSSVTIIASPDGFNAQMYAATVVSTGGASVPFTIELESAGDYAIGAFAGDNPDAIDVSTPIGFYRDFTPVSLPPGGSASGVDFTIALDTVAPVVALAFPVAGSTVAALPVVEGSGYDANGVGDVELAVQDTDANLWYDPNVPGWVASAAPLYRSVNAEVIGPSNAVEWSVAISSVDNGNFGRLDERLVQGHHYRILAVAGDFVGHPSAPAQTTFTWGGPTGNVGPQQPSALNGQALGVSSIAWSWNASQGATAYFLASSSYTAPFASVTTTSYISEGLLPAETRMLCVAGVNLLIAGGYSCSTAETLPAVPGAVAAAEVFETSVTWSWTNGGNSANASYELSLSTDGFAAHVSTPLPVGFYHRAASYTAQGLAPNTVYSARVRAYNLGLALSDFSATGSTRTSIGALQPPFNVTALFSRAEAKVTLSWTAPDPAPASYRVYRGTETGNLALLGGTTDTAFADFPGVSAFYFYAVSALGELGGESPLSGVQSVRFDVTPPQFLSLLPADGATLSRPYTVSAQVSDDFTSASVRFDVDGIARATTTVSHQFLWDVREETAGLHTLTAVATDDDGNQMALSRSVTVAYSTPAAPTIIVPSDDYSTLATTFTIQGYAPLLTSVSVYLDAQAVGTSAVDGIGQWSLDPATFPARGDFLLTAVAYETGGKSAPSAPRRVASFAVPPAEPGPVSAAVDRQTGLVELTWGASAGTTPAVDYRVERATVADGEYLVLASTPTTTYIDFPGAAGDYRYRVRAAHGSGLLSAYVSTTVAYDLTPPPAIADLRFTAYRPEAGQLDLAWTAASDDFSGVARQLLVSSPSGLFDADASTTVVAAQAPGSTVTVTVPVGAGAARFRVYSEDAVDNRSYASNTILFDPVPPVISAFDLNEGAVVSRPRYLTPSVTDNTGVVRVEYRVDGSLFASSSQAPFDVLWNLLGVVDGARTVSATAFDAFGSSASVTRAVTVNYAPPAAPVITSPFDGFVTNSASVTVSGTAPVGTTVQLQLNGLDLAAVQTGGSGFWSAAVLLPLEGELTMTALSFEPRGFSGPSAPVRLTYTTTAPNPPILVQTSVLSGGRARITWQPGPGKAASTYRVYRSVDDLDLIPGAAAPGAAFRVGSGITGLEFTDFPPADELYFYAVTARDGAGNESLLSDAPYAFVDRNAPTARVTLTTAPVLGPGAYPFTLTLSEVLAAVPVLTFTPFEGSPAAQTLDGVTGTVWRGTLTVTGAMNPGVASFAFEGRDLASNVGTVLTSGATVALDTRGPIAEIALSRASPVNAGALGVVLVLDEPAASAPSLSWTPNGASALALSLTEGGALNGRTWNAELAVATDTPQGEAVFLYSARDGVGNTGTALTGAATSFFIDTIAPGAPILPHANPGPGGLVALTWSGPAGELPASYRVSRDGLTLTTVPVAADRTGAYADTAADGSHAYGLVSLDLAGNASAVASVSATADSIPPAAPQGLSVSLNGFGQIELAWTSGGADTANFRLYRATEAIGNTAGLVPRAAASPFLDSPTADGDYRYVVTARDAAGNESAPSNQVTLHFDRAAPIIEVAGVTGGELTNQNRTITFTVTDANLNAASITALLDGAPFASGSTVASEGDHVLSITASDLESHSSTVTVSFAIDKTAPVLAAGVADGALLVGVSSFPVSATDLHLSASSFLLVNDTLGSTVAYRSGDLINRDGAYRLLLTASDGAGNSSERTIAFSVDAAPGAPLSLAVKAGATARLTWTRPEPDVIAYRVYRDGSRVSASLHAGTAFEDAGYTPTGRVYEVSAIDAAGVEGPRARATVPAATLSLAPRTLTRGFFDALRLNIVNGGVAPLAAGPSSITVKDAAGISASATPGSVTVGAGQTGQLEGVVATPVGLGAASLSASVPVPTDAGASVALVGDFPISAAEPAQPLLEVLPGPLMPGTLSPVQIRLFNRGSAAMDVITAQVQNSTFAAVDSVKVQLRTPEGTLLGSSGLLQAGNGANAVLVGGEQYFFVSIPAGQSFLFDPVQAAVPNTTLASLSVLAQVSTPTYNLPFISLPGSRGFSSSLAQGTVAQVPYTATVASDRHYYDQGSSVTVTGLAVDTISGYPVPNVSVAVHVVSNGYDRQLNAVADSTGAYRTAFFPLPNEAGVYSLSAAHPAVISKAVQSSFTIVGLSWQYTSFTATLARNSSYRFTVDLTNTGGTEVTGLSSGSVALSGAGVGLVVDSLPASLAAGAKATVGVTLTAVPSASSSTFALVVTEAHGFTRSIPVTATVVPAEVIPVVTPQQFAIGMLSGESRVVSIVIENKGFDTWRGVEVTNPALAWAALQGQASLGDIPPGGNANISLVFNPPSSLANGTYDPQPLLQITSLNVPPVPILGSVAITSSRTGDVQLSVINADKPRNASGQGVPVEGAKAVLTSLDVAGLSFNVAADLNGLAQFAQVPAGNYTWRAEAQGFQTVSGTVVIEPGMINRIEAILPTATVSYQWTVTPTTIIDKYNITLNLTFQTDVPAPAIVIEPAFAQVNIDIGQSAFGQYTLTNKGLVSVFDFQLNPSAEDGLVMELPFTSIPEIRAGQSVVVPYKLTYVHYSDHCKAANVGHKGQYPCAAGTNIVWQGSAFSATVGPANACGGGTASSGGGGGGGGGGWPVSGISVSKAPPAATGGGCGSGSAKTPRHLQNCSRRGADPRDGSHFQPSNAPLFFSGPMAPSYAPNYSSFDPASVNPPAGAPAATNNPPGWAPPVPTVQMDPDGGALTQINPDGSREQVVPLSDLSQPSNGSGAQFSLPVQNYAVWHFDNSSQNPLKQTTPDGTVTEFAVYGSSTYLPISITDRNGNILNYIRDENGLLLKTQDSFGRWIAFTYNAQGKLEAASDNAGRSTSYGYNPAGDKISETDVNGDVTQYAYDANHRMTLITYPNGGHMTLVYDAQGRVSTEQFDGGVGRLDYTYHASSTVVVDALSHATKYDWTEVQGLRRFTRIVDADGGVTTLAYDTSMNLVSRTDPLGRVTRMQYDDRGNVTSATDPLGKTVLAAYEPAFNQPTSVTDAKGNRTTLSYDAKGNLTTLQDALNNFSNFAYDQKGHVTASKDALGKTSNFGYDAKGALTSASDPLGRTVGVTRDALSRATVITDPANRQTAMSYDAAGNVTQVTDADSGATIMTYEAGRGGRLPKTVKDAKNHTTTTNYDVLGRVTSVVNALGQAASITYDDKSRPKSATNRNGQSFGFTYDSLDRLTRLTAVEGNIDLTYDAVGRLLTAGHYNGSALAMSYDAVNRMTQQVQTLPNGFNATLGYAYDANGNRTQMTTPWGSFSYTYDSLDRVTSITNPYGQVVTFTYDALGRRTQMNYPNGTKTTYAYDAAGQIGQVLHQKTADQTAIAFTNYAYDVIGNRTGLTDINGSRVFTYDVLNRLVTATQPGQTESFAYDAVGNRTADAERTGYTYNNANRIVSDSSFTYTSDANGNVTSRTSRATGVTTTLVHNSGNQIAEALAGGAEVGSYKYDTAGRRVEKNAGGTITRFVYDGPNILAILDADNNLLALFTHGPGIDSPLIVRRGVADYFYHADALGSVVALTDSIGGIVETYEYAAFGKTTIKDASGMQHAASLVGNPFMYTSRELDAETGFYFYRARYYDPESGRFLEEDPIPSVNQFTYAANNPMLFIDPLGLESTGNGAPGHVAFGISIPLFPEIPIVNLGPAIGVKVDAYGHWYPYVGFGGGINYLGGSIVGYFGDVQTGWSTSFSGNAGPGSFFLTGTIDQDGTAGLGGGTPGYSITKSYTLTERDMQAVKNLSDWMTSIHDPRKQKEIFPINDARNFGVQWSGCPQRGQ